MSTPVIYFVTGISGSGKTTVARELVSRGEIAFDSKLTKDIFHFVDKAGKPAEEKLWQDQDWQKKYKWSLNSKLFNELLREHNNAKRIFLCGRGNIRQHWDLAAKVFLLKIDSPTLVTRLNSKTRDNYFARDAHTQEKLLSQLAMVQNNLISAGAIAIDATKPLAAVVAKILSLSD